MQLISNFYLALQAGDVAAFHDILSADWEEIPPVYPGQARGPAAYAPVVAGIRAGLPDVEFEILEIIEAAPKYIVRSRFHGTHGGTFLGRPATGRRLHFDAIDIHEVQGERIVRTWHIEDFMSAIKQMS